MDLDYDVIVVGSGAAGLAAAVSAADEGASVLIVEADTKVGGSSRLSGGHFYAAGTSFQAEAGVEDNPDAMFEHYMTLNQWLVEPSVVRKYCDLSAPSFEWLQSLGVEFEPDGLYCSGVGSTPRGHVPIGAGEAVVQKLDANRSSRGVDLVLDSRVDELLTDESGAVCGIRIGEDKAMSGAVVLATGGFGANKDMLNQLYPQASKNGDWSWYIGTEHAQGDGLTLGGEVGAAIDGHDRGLLLVTPGFSRDMEVLLPGWLILVNESGRRFCNETAPYTVLAGLLNHQGGKIYAIFDEGARIDAKPSPASQAYWVSEVLEKKAKDGVIAKADSLAVLAQTVGVRGASLESTVREYNEDCGAGTDNKFFKAFETGMRPIVEPPFYAAEIRPAIICWTGAGLRINAETQVINKNEEPIPGLYAAGETVGSLHGDRYIGGGGSYGPCIVFGKLAGANAALRSKGN